MKSFRTTGSEHAASLFFTRFTRLLTSYRRINAGLNGFIAHSVRLLEAGVEPQA
jgi:hypothetical protein